jgi:hypothetical protein
MLFLIWVSSDSIICVYNVCCIGDIVVCIVYTFLRDISFTFLFLFLCYFDFTYWFILRFLFRFLFLFIYIFLITSPYLILMLRNQQPRQCITIQLIYFMIIQKIQYLRILFYPLITKLHKLSQYNNIRRMFITHIININKSKLWMT